MTTASPPASVAVLDSAVTWAHSCLQLARTSDLTLPPSARLSFETSIEYPAAGDAAFVEYSIDEGGTWLRRSRVARGCLSSVVRILARVPAGRLPVYSRPAAWSSQPNV